MLFLTREERETIISWNDEDGDKIWVYSSQQPMVRRLRRNPLFELKSECYNKNYKCYPSPISVEGYLPRKALTIRTKRIELSREEKERRVKRLRFAHKSPNDSRFSNLNGSTNGLMRGDGCVDELSFCGLDVNIFEVI
jgi:hypothetical protein